MGDAGKSDTIEKQYVFGTQVMKMGNLLLWTIGIIQAASRCHRKGCALPKTSNEASKKAFNAN
jgi:hypothetical protein